MNERGYGGDDNQNFESISVRLQQLYWQSVKCKLAQDATVETVNHFKTQVNVKPELLHRLQHLAISHTSPVLSSAALELACWW
jgi:hypothetical protein